MKKMIIFTIVAFMTQISLANTALIQLNSKLASMIPAESTGIVIPGTTEGGRGCELSIEKFNGGISSGITYMGRMGLGLFDLAYSKNNVTAVSTAVGEISVKYKNSRNQINEENKFYFNQNGRLVAAEVLEEKSGLLGRSMKSEIKCRIGY